MKSINQLMAMKSLLRHSGCKNVETVLLTDGMDETTRTRQTTVFINKVANIGSANVALIAVKF
jgi:hypothetical protein